MNAHIHLAGPFEESTAFPPDLAEVIDEYHRALDAFVRGDPEPVKGLYSRRQGLCVSGASS